LDPLEAVEVLLGPIESWPTYIIRHMFVEDPNVRNTENVAGFF
jgi:hypothetical protein